MAWRSYGRKRVGVLVILEAIHGRCGCGPLVSCCFALDVDYRQDFVLLLNVMFFESVLIFKLQSYATPSANST